MNKKNGFSIWKKAWGVVLLQLACMAAIAQLNWPIGQLLPSFPATSQSQDLIYLPGTTAPGTNWRWEAEGPSISHGTGRLETDGWLCQTGIDAANRHMVYGPYDRSITAGPNVAEFRMKIDNNTANNDAVVDIDVRNATTGATLASQTITRQQFSVAGSYVSFMLNFYLPSDNQSIELRVYWKGNSYIKVDWVGVAQNNVDAEMYLFSSLKGIVNRNQPRIFSYEGDAFAEGPYTWMQSLGLSWNEYPDKWQLLTKYRSELSGLIVYDPAQIHTVNLATMLAKDRKALIAAPSLLSKLTSAPYNLPVLVDLRGQYTSKLQVYQTIYNTYWPNLDKRLLIGLNPEAHKAALREYATAVGSAVIWLDPKVTAESTLLNSFLSSMPAGANYMGWWPEEEPGVSRASTYGITTIASDWCANLTVHSGTPRTINVRPIPAKPALQNKIYVAFILSDGDNLQYVEHLMRKLWNNPDRGSVPIGWTVSPAMVDAMPGALNFYQQTSTNNDNLISGPSGYGYTYPNNWPDQNKLNQFVAKTEEYNRTAGLRVITIWNTITGGINQNVGQTFANYAPTLLGITAQNTGGALSIYNSSLPGMPLSCNYCTNEQAMKDHIASAAAGWNGTSPRFIIIQAQPWTDVKPTNFKNVMNSLNSNYIVVRPDHIFQLIRESKGLPINPGDNPVNGNGDGLTGSYYNGMNFETPVATRKDANINFNWGTGSPMSGVNTDNYSVKWTGQIQPRYSGAYTFYITSDNGRRVWVNNQLIIDKWIDDWDITYTGTINLTAGQKYDIKVEYFENVGGANCKLEWSSAYQAREIVPQSQLYSTPETGDGLTGSYFNGMNFETPVLTRKDANLNFNWGTGSPATGINSDGFSARWTGSILPRYSNTYTFYIASDNGRRVWVNNQLIIDKWIDNWDITYSGTIALNANQKYDIKVEYFENYGGANIKLEWSGAQQAREIIPQSQLFSTSALKSAPIEALSKAADNQLLVYPNPVKDRLNINLDSPVEITICTIYGQKITQTISTSVEVEYLAPGMYIANIKHNNNVYSIKFIKN
ncbi:MAG: T9SS type A sorting domain-containing protein [Bacteroidales bacterium]|nr:T9SS type A sorting domain-containing protein [Bacteroidales bacterium]